MSIPSVAPDPGAVVENVAAKRFELAVDGTTAFIDYRRAPGLVTLLHAEVPSQFAGRGVGAALVRGALDKLRAEGARVVSHCSFVNAYVARHPEYRNLLA